MFNGNAVWKLNLIECTEQWAKINRFKSIANPSFPLIRVRNGGEWSHDGYTQLDWDNWEVWLPTGWLQF